MTAAPAAEDRTLIANGLELRYRDWVGSGRQPALAFHGFALNAHSWDEVAPALSQRVRLLAFDQRGHGRSQWARDLSEYSRDHLVSDIEAIADALGLQRPVLIGHSMGGMNSMTFAARNPDRVRGGRGTGSERGWGERGAPLRGRAVRAGQP